MITGTFKGIPVSVEQASDRRLLYVRAFEGEPFDGSTHYGGAFMKSWALAYRHAVKDMRSTRIGEKNG